MRVLVVDDSTVFRKVVRDALAGQADVEVVGVAADGLIALDKIDFLKPDLVTLDVEMPGLDGLGVLREMRTRGSVADVLIVSSATSTAAAQTARALRLGAFDFILKPSDTSLERNVARLRAELEPRIRQLSDKQSTTVSRAATSSDVPRPNTAGAACPRQREVIPSVDVLPRLLAIGVSTGGPAALADLLPKLPATFPIPIVIVQHMPPIFTKSLADDFDRNCAIHVREASDREVLQAGVAYLAPGGRQTRIVAGSLGPEIQLTDDPPERNCRPSVDYLFRSVAEVYAANVMALVLTGMGDDGVAGCRLLKSHGARVVAQDQASSVVYGMPRQVVEAGLADVVCPLGEMHDQILRCVSKGASA
jgi:two-component system chemotaxis response regulator CheB